MRVTLAEDSTLLREGMAALFESAGIEVVAQLGEAESLLRQVAADPPDLVVTDIRMPPSQTTEGLEAAVSIKQAWPEVGVLVLSQHVETYYALRLLEEGRGGVGYLLKDRVMNLAEFLSAVRRVAAGETVVDGEVVARILQRQRKPGPLDDLTEREHDVLGLMAEGWTNSALAERLSISPKTIETHVGNIFMKLGLHPGVDEHRRVLAVLTYLRA